MTTLEETIPVDEEGATLLPKPKSTGIRRIVAAAALASFVIGVLAATAVQTSPGRHASNLISKPATVSVRIEDAKTHKMCMTVQGDEGKKNAGLVLYERCTGASTQVFEYDAKNGQLRYGELCVHPLFAGKYHADRFGLESCSAPSTVKNPALSWDKEDGSITLDTTKDDIRADTLCMTETDKDIIEAMPCEKGKPDQDQRWDMVPTSTPDKAVTIKNAQISLVSDKTKCITVADRSDIYLTLEKCGGGDGSGDHSKQRFTYTYKDGSGRITYDHPTGLVNTLTIEMAGGDGSDMVLWYAESDSEMPSQNLRWAGGGSSSSRRLQAIEKKEFVYPNMTADAEGRRLSTWAGLWEHSGFSCPADMYDATGGDSNYWACGKGCAGGKQTDGTCNCACQCRSGSPAELRNSDGPCELGGKEITIQNGEGLCVAASGTKNGKRIIAQKCKAGSSKQQWQIGDATVLPSDDDPPSEPRPSLCAAENCAAPGACVLIDGYKHGVPNKFHCEVNPAYFTDASVCEGDDGIWCDAPP